MVKPFPAFVHSGDVKSHRRETGSLGQNGSRRAAASTALRHHHGAAISNSILPSAQDSLGVTSPSLSIASSAQAASQGATFEPILPDTSLLIGMGSVTVLCVIAAIVWANQVVPVSRTKLALSKKKGGEVRDYLDELQESEDRSMEKWLFTDWLNNDKRKKDPALPLLPKAKWNSGDNPVLVTSALLMVGVLIAAVTERVGTVLQ
jgi:hypothetical protein